MRGTIFKHVGSYGLYKEDSTLIDTYNTAGGIKAGSGPRQISESWPATPDYFYEGTSYSNAMGKGLIVIRRVSRQEAEQIGDGDAE